MVNWHRFGSTVWQERRYLDAWSVNHFLAGVLLASVAVFFVVSLTIAAPLALALFILWELFERLIDAGEAFPNQLLDVVVDAAGFAVGWLLWGREVLDAGAFIAVAAVFAALLAWGYYSKIHYSLTYD